ncbi:hypothetical protein [Cellulomonas phragmiteti]|uniref:Uncharacterized protein n=1 Tax=Cellulomonas phragmiteti TaxID=478780 RepID=A0ABQ4DI26_9CELL|nr:hypothetical protein [Cellulomonas phragmiteti]GIG39000.1 hypothetical protein Cph01nite_07620 [Cellulomonas phragmiteti]
MSTTIDDDRLRPDDPAVRRRAEETLGARLDEGAAADFVSSLTAPSAPAPIGATASLNLAVWGKVEVTTDGPDGQRWSYHTTVWGGPAYFGSSVGFLYTAYDSWSAFFANAHAVHVQGITSPVGVLQVNWFNRDGTPVGQFNGAAGGIGLVEAGGDGSWRQL